MSLKAIPLCSNCSRCTAKDIFCTNCYRMGCVLCFNLQTGLADDAATEDDRSDTVRLCPECIDRLTVKQEPMDQPCTSTKQDPELCGLHGKPLKLYCSNCSMCICGECLSDEKHDMHNVNTLGVVYKEKLAEVERKLAEMEKKLASSAVYESNLEKLENEEQSIKKAVLTMKEKALSSLSSMTAKRKATLKSKVRSYADKRKRLLKLRKTVKKLTARDFLAKRSEIDGECDDMMIGVTPKCDLETVDDFNCDLVPQYTYANLSCAGLTTATSGFVFGVKSACAVAWKVTVCKLLTTTLQVMLEPKDSGMTKFAHKLIVIIPHKADPTKEIRKAFDVEGTVHTFKIVEMSHLEEHGFFQDGGNLLLKVGIRPLNVLVEKALLSNTCTKLTVQNLNLKMQLKSIECPFDNKHWISYFELPVELLLKTDVNRSGSNISDDAGRRWRLKVIPTMVGGLLTQVGAYVELISGSRTKCKFFIELKHQDARKTIVRKTSYHFEKADWGWKYFVSWNEDKGFYPDGKLLFRYGVQPLPN